MAKKTRTPKTPRIKGGGKTGRGSKDAVTGLYWEFESVDWGGKRIRAISDTQIDNYDAWLETTNGRGERAESIQGRGDSISEFELSEKFMVYTQKDYDRATGEERFVRSVLQGSFKYNNKALTSADISDFAQMSLTRRVDGMEQYGSLKNYPSGWKISSLLPTYMSSNYISPNFPQEAQSTTRAGFYYSPDIGYLEGSLLDKTTVESFQGGRFFQEGWWNNPFAPNLI
jgi:hypothetical protein